MVLFPTEKLLPGSVFTITILFDISTEDPSSLPIIIVTLIIITTTIIMVTVTILIFLSV